MLWEVQALLGAIIHEKCFFHTCANICDFLCAKMGAAARLDVFVGEFVHESVPVITVFCWCMCQLVNVKPEVGQKAELKLAGKRKDILDFSSFCLTFAVSCHILHCTEPITDCHESAPFHSDNNQLPPCFLPFFLSSSWCRFHSLILLFTAHLILFSLIQFTSCSISSERPAFLHLLPHPRSVWCQERWYSPCKHETDQRADEDHHLVKHGWVCPLDRPVQIILQIDEKMKPMKIVKQICLYVGQNWWRSVTE